jgi:hypothetical protein
MNGLRRAILVLFGVAMGIAAGLVVLPIAALIDPVTREAGFALAEFTFFTLTRTGLEGMSESDGVELLHFVWTAVVAICVMPLVFSVMIGEIAKVRSFVWYAGATGLVAAGAPWLVRAAFHLQKATTASPEELRFALVFFFSGIVSGAVFWVVAGNAPGEPDSKPN